MTISYKYCIIDILKIFTDRTERKERQFIMAKPNRGIELKRNKPGVWRGTCPLCGKQRVRKIWNVVNGAETLTVCKLCRNKKVAQ